MRRSILLLCLLGGVVIAADPKPPKPAQTNTEPPASDNSPQAPVRVERAATEARARNRENSGGLRAAIVPANSFWPPFDEYDDASGERTIKSSWKTGGHTDVHENFVRLTNDRQSKMGYVHNIEPIAMMDFSAYINFRISGAGQRLYGDGIAIWVTDLTEPDWRRGGTFMGGPADFKGFVIVLDTFKNAEMGSSHKDVMLYVNDGTDDVDPHRPQAGAVANYRYFEGRDDFSVLDYSSMHLMYRASTKTVIVMLDEKNTGDFKTLFEFKIESLPRGWDKELRISFSATTGQLADNHDLLSVKIIKAGGRLPRNVDDEDVNPREIQSLERQVQKQSGGAQIAKLMKLYRRDQERRLNHLHHAIEHELSFIQDSLASAISKIRAAEEDDHKRIEVLERKAEQKAREVFERHLPDAISAHVDDAIQGSVDSVLDSVHQKTDEKIAQAVHGTAQMHHKTLSQLADAVENAGGGGGAGWITIVVLCTVFGAVLYFLSRRVARMEKNHLP